MTNVSKAEGRRRAAHEARLHPSLAEEVARDFDIHECQLCNHGTVEGWINGELVETWDCPECAGTGFVNRNKLLEQNDCIAACRKAESMVDL